MPSRRSSRSASCSWPASARACLLVTFFAAYAAWRYRRTRGAPSRRAGRRALAILDERLHLGQKFAALPRVLPFVLLLTGVMIALYGGFATPSETAGLGAILALVLIAVIYSTWRPKQLEPIIGPRSVNRPC